MPTRAARLAAPLVASLLAAVGPAAGSWTVETVGPCGHPEPMLALHPDGRPAVVYNKDAKPRYAIRTDGFWAGETLLTPWTAQDGRSGPGLDLKNFTVSSLVFQDDQPVVGYVKFPESDLWVARRAAGTWSFERLSQYTIQARLALGADGLLRILFNEYGAYRHGTLFPAGWSFDPAPAGFELAVDPFDRSHLAGVTFPDHEIFWARRDAAGWVTEFIGRAGTGLSLAVDGAGQPRIACVGTDRAIHYAERTPAGWTHEVVAAGAGTGGGTSIALGAGGEPFIAYMDSVRKETRFARRAGSGWTTELIDPAFCMDQRCWLVIDAAGRPHVAYCQNRGATWVVRYATAAPVTGVESAAPGASFAIAALGPNPARRGGSLAIALALERPDRVELRLFDVAGRRVAVREAADLPGGTTAIRWSPRVERAGVYVLEARGAGGGAVTRRVAFLR